MGELRKYRVTFTHRAGKMVVKAPNAETAEKIARRKMFGNMMTNVGVQGTEEIK